MKASKMWIAAPTRRVCSRSKSLRRGIRVGIRLASLNAAQPVEKDTRTVIRERRAPTKGIKYPRVLPVMDPITFYMRLCRIPRWPPALITVKTIDCRRLSCDWAAKANTVNKRISSGTMSSHCNIVTNSSRNSSSLMKNVVRSSWSGLD
jgi:hypothetical protein